LGQQGRFDLLVVDAPATGHGITFLDVPRVVVSAVRAGPLRRHAGWVEEMVRHPDETLLLPVALAEELPARETAELVARLRDDVGIAMDRVVVNAVARSPVPDSVPDLAERLERLPAKQLGVGKRMGQILLHSYIAIQDRPGAGVTEPLWMRSPPPGRPAPTMGSLAHLTGASASQPDAERSPEPAMKKFRVNVQRLSITLGVLGTSAGLLALAAGHHAPLAAFQRHPDPLLESEVSADRATGLGALAAPAPEAATPITFDPIVDVVDASQDDREYAKAGKHGPTQMMIALQADGAPVDGWVLGSDVLADRSEPEGEPPVAAPVVPLTHRQATGGAAPQPRRVQVAAATRVAAFVPPIEPAQPIEKLTAASAEVSEAQYDASRRMLRVPFNGVLNRDQLAIHRLGDGRAYIDMPGAKPTFSGSRSENVAEGPITRWAMASQAAPGGRPITRLAFRLVNGARPRLEIDGTELRIALVQPGVAVVNNPVPPATRAAGAAAAAAPIAVAAMPTARLALPRIGEARYDAEAAALRLPVAGRLDPGALSLHRLGDDQAYLDITGAAPTFSGLRSGGNQGHALAQWTMAAIPDAGYPLTRLFVKLGRPGEVSAQVAGGEIRLSVTDLAPSEPLEQLDEAVGLPSSDAPLGDAGAADPIPAN
ncbi:MAG: hypothetical protein VKQ33_09895, partial [Candidatus Sericytochromatia bacterium]|nr:hypothetical protein [Candidatus Sericytochromatia bacterium]